MVLDSLSRRGAVLPLVLGILLAVTLLLTSLLQLPGGVRRVALRHAQMQQQIYDAESALIACLEGFPEDYFKLPKVDRSRLGPWTDLSAEVDSIRSVHVLAGIACDSACNMLKSHKLRREIYEGFKQQLNQEIMLVKHPLKLEIKSGNRRILGRDTGQIPSTALQVLDGDLTLDLEGEIPSGRFIADGSVKIRGNVVFDTLRVYARGPLTFRGRLKARFLEAFSEDRIEISSGVEFSGVAIARHEVAFPNGADKVRMRYPSFVMAAESANLPLESEQDSILIPDFISGDLKPFQWSLR
ncbi:hypothetical protein [Fibrobacter sp. UWB5]|uniref:hypothetical protein n=1 Tax=Fibrobacter sp. UWB5 TaxID=1964360 RepID=UPI000B716D4E|nr:hypothetical protein [Fibrobacter sp. UWB5]OWV11738.1 hypothetical protein B7989_08870 [Fibrobacter sp. UWB5]